MKEEEAFGGVWSVESRTVATLEREGDASDAGHEPPVPHSGSGKAGQDIGRSAGSKGRLLLGLHDERHSPGHIEGKRKVSWACCLQFCSNNPSLCPHD